MKTPNTSVVFYNILKIKRKIKHSKHLNRRNTNARGQFEILGNIARNHKNFLPFVYSKEAAVLPEVPETGKFYRVYPENCRLGDGSQYHGLVRIGRQPDKLIVFLTAVVFPGIPIPLPA